MQRYKLTIEYDGTNFSGWQIQPDSRTVEEEIEKAFSQILQQPIDLLGQGRTDAGVHAMGQVAHVDLPDSINPEKLTYGVNGLVGNEIHIHEMTKVDDEFHSRFDAEYREYEYSILTKASPLKRQSSWFPNSDYEIDKVKECISLLMGEFDFSNFSKYNEENYTTLCTILLCEMEEIEGELIVRIRANRFLRNMVRRLVGTIIEVGKGKMSVQEFEELLKNPGKKTPTYTAPAKGLRLIRVFY